MLAIISFFFAFCNTVAPPAVYYAVDYKNFYQLPEVNQKVDWDNLNVTLLEAAIFQCTNEQRILNGKKVFTYANDLNKAATYHSNSMVKYNFFSHTNNFEKNMKAFYQRTKFFGGSFNGSGENIAYAEFDNSYTYLDVAKDIMDMWMESAGHRENVLSPVYVELGCGIAVKKMPYWNRVYATQDFGGKRNTKIN